jgi:hypothetical protein
VYTGSIPIPASNLFSKNQSSGPQAHAVSLRPRIRARSM